MKKRILILSLTIITAIILILACAFVLVGCLFALRFADDDFIYRVRSGHVELEFVRDENSSELIIPESVIYKNKTYKVEEIGGKAFQDCTSLKSVTIGKSVKKIGSEAFEGCYRLVEVYNKSSLNIVKGSYENGGVGYYAKEIYTKEYQSKIITTDDGYVVYYDGNTKSLIQYIGSEKNLTLPYGITEINHHAFAYCNDLNSITIPDGVTSIGKDTFNRCYKLTNITIPSSVTSIGEYAFYGCDSLKYNEYSNVLYLGNSVNPYVILVKAKSTNITEYAIHNGTSVIYCDAFWGCSNLVSITIPDSVTSIGEGAWSGSALDKVYITDLAKWCEISFGNSTANPLRYARDLYLNGERVTELVIPNTVTRIGSNAFSGFSSLRRITIPESVTTIGFEAFSGCGGLINVIIPDSVTSIGARAFSGCGGLMNVTIGKSVASIGYDAFSDCNRLDNVYIADLAKWCEISFGNYKANPLSYAHELMLDGMWVTKLVIPDGVTSIGYGAFYGCSCLVSVTIPDSVTSIGYGAFYGCSRLDSVTIGNSVKSIGEYAFEYCDYLTSVIIPDGVTSIGYGAFDGCSHLVSVTIPESVTTIGEFAFYGCSSLKSITISGNVESIGKFAFKRCENLTIYCEAQSQPSGWDSNWNSSNCPVFWGHIKNNND